MWIYVNLNNLSKSSGDFDCSHVQRYNQLGTSKEVYFPVHM